MKTKQHLMRRIMLDPNEGATLDREAGPPERAETALVPQTTALARRDELAIAQKQYEDAYKEWRADGLRFTSALGGVIGGFGSGGALTCALFALHPVTAVVGGVLLLCGGVSAAVTASKRIAALYAQIRRLK